ncbi:hypothetical protein Taro_030939 [Colocasia esculenta]|uniref:Uncharacterized protein n=1 Tax=Colocasia esculenta TaxID=4460 RepID=A0A843VQI1_COLES|nr:hypothetical protein [Colocasia esculenta]
MPIRVAGVSVRLVALSRRPCRARSCCGPLTHRVKVHNATGRSVTFWLPKVKSLGRRSPSVSFFPLVLTPAVLGLPLSPLCVSGEEEGRACCYGVVDLAWSEEEVAMHREGPSWVRFFVTSREFLCPSRSEWIGSPSGFIDTFIAFPMLPSPLCCDWMVCGRLRIEDPVGLPPCWCRDGSAHRDIRGGVSPLGCDLIATRLVVVIRLSHRASRSRQDCCRGAFLPSRTGLSRGPSPLRWCCDSLGGRDSTCIASGLRLPCMVRVHVAVGCSYCCAACVASVVARCVRAMLARLAVVFPYGGHLQASPGAVLLVFGSVGGGTTLGVPGKGSERSGRYSGDPGSSGLIKAATTYHRTLRWYF